MLYTPFHCAGLSYIYKFLPWRYVAPPGINSTGAAPLTPFTGAPSSSMLPPPGPTTPVSSTSYLNPDLSGLSAAQGVASPFMAEISTPSAYSASAAAPSMNLSTFPSYAQDAPPQMDLTQSQSGADMVQVKCSSFSQLQYYLEISWLLLQVRKTGFYVDYKQFCYISLSGP